MAWHACYVFLNRVQRSLRILVTYIFPFFSRVFVATMRYTVRLLRPIHPRIHRAISKHGYSQIASYCSIQNAIIGHWFESTGTRCFACLMNLSRNNGETSCRGVTMFHENVFPRIFKLGKKHFWILFRFYLFVLRCSAYVFSNRNES